MTAAPNPLDMAGVVERLDAYADDWRVARDQPHPQWIGDLTALLSAFKERGEALEAIRDLDTRSHHDGYDDGPGGGNYIYRDVIFTDEAFPLIDAVMEPQT